MDSKLPSTVDSQGSRPASSTERDRDAKFLAMLPRIRRQAAYYLRLVPRQDRADAVEEVVARAFVNYVRLIERGKANLASGSVVHTFTSGTTVQVFLLDGHVSAGTTVQSDAGGPA